MNRDQAYALHTILSKASAKNLKKATLIKYIKVKIALNSEKEIIDDFRDELVAGIDQEKEDWNSEFSDALVSYLKEDIELEGIQVFDIEEIVDIISNNNFNGEEELLIYKFMYKE